MSGCKDFEALEIVLLPVKMFVDQATDKQREYYITRVRMMFSKLERWLRPKGSKEKASDIFLENVKGKFKKFKMSVKETVDEPCRMGQYGFISSLLDHFLGSLSWFASLELSISFAFEQFNVHINGVPAGVAVKGQGSGGRCESCGF